MSLRRLLTSMCTVQSLSTTTNAIGEVINSYSAGTPLVCRVDPLRAAGEGVDADRPMALNRFRVYMEAGAITTEGARIQQGGKSFNVLQVNDFAGHHLEVEIERFE